MDTTPIHRLNPAADLCCKRLTNPIEQPNLEAWIPLPRTVTEELDDGLGDLPTMLCQLRELVQLCLAGPEPLDLDELTIIPM